MALERLVVINLRLHGYSAAEEEGVAYLHAWLKVVARLVHVGIVERGAEIDAVLLHIVASANTKIHTAWRVGHIVIT